MALRAFLKLDGSEVVINTTNVSAIEDDPEAPGCTLIHSGGYTVSVNMNKENVAGRIEEP